VVLKESVNQHGEQTKILDILNPPGMFSDGKRQQEYSNRCILPASGRLLPEFDLDKRRSIKDMFARKPTPLSSNSAHLAATPAAVFGAHTNKTPTVHPNLSPGTREQKVAAHTIENTESPQTAARKRPRLSSTAFRKYPKPSAATSSGISIGSQKTLKGFFKPKATNDYPTVQSPTVPPTSWVSPLNCESSKPSHEDETASFVDPGSPSITQKDIVPTAREGNAVNNDFLIDPIASKEDWSKLFTKRPAPSCDGHKEPCISLTTKKPGMNRGRLFWICSRPLGPNGEKEKGTQWRCPTFIWASDWNSSAGLHES
jgi:AP endonuclease-2